VVAGDDNVQRHLIEMWSEILGVAQVGPHEDFFALVQSHATFCAMGSSSSQS
jgi:hypothetical protein